jgi:hypothetical protein
VQKPVRVLGKLLKTGEIEIKNFVTHDFGAWRPTLAEMKNPLALRLRGRPPEV